MYLSSTPMEKCRSIGICNKIISFNRNIFCAFIFVIIFLSIPRSVKAEIVINEFSASTTQDWVELYNTGTESASLTSLRIRDSSSNKKDLEGDLNSGGFYVVSFSNWLNNGGDIVRLVRVNGETESMIEEIGYGANSSICLSPNDGSIGKKPDGSNSWVVFSQSSKGTSNNQSPESSCPTSTPQPSPTNLPTSKPTVTSKPTIIPSETKISTPTKTSAVSNSANTNKISTAQKNISSIPRTITEVAVEISPQSLVLGESSGSSNSVSAANQTTGKSPLQIFYFLIITGIAFLGAAMYFSFKNTKKRD